MTLSNLTVSCHKPSSHNMNLKHIHRSTIYNANWKSHQLETAPEPSAGWTTTSRSWRWFPEPTTTEAVRCRVARPSHATEAEDFRAVSLNPTCQQSIHTHCTLQAVTVADGLVLHTGNGVGYINVVKLHRTQLLTVLVNFGGSTL